MGFIAPFIADFLQIVQNTDFQQLIIMWYSIYHGMIDSTGAP